MTTEEIQYIKSKYNILSSASMSKKLKCSKGALLRWAKNIGLKKTPQKRKLTREEKSFLVENYSVLPTLTIAKRLNCHTCTVDKIAKKLKLENGWIQEL